MPDELENREVSVERLNSDIPQPRFEEAQHKGEIIIGCLPPFALFVFLLVSVTNMNRYEFHHSFAVSLLWGLLVAFVILSLVIMTAGGHTLMEIGITCFIFLALFLFLMPVFRNARERARIHKHSALSQQLSVTPPVAPRRTSFPFENSPFRHPSPTL